MGGYIMAITLNNDDQNEISNNATNATLNHTNNSSNAINNSSKTTTKKSVSEGKSPVISASKACKIVTKSFSGYDCYGSGAALITANGKAIYSVTLRNRADDSYAGEVLVDAETGKILS